MFRGNHPTRVDEKGRLKVPANFRKIIEDRYGPDCFITSTDGERALVYPLPVWFDFQNRLSKVPSTSVPKTKLLERVLSVPSRLYLVPVEVKEGPQALADFAIVINNQHGLSSCRDAHPDPLDVRALLAS